MKHLYGLRTFIFGILCLLCLVLGLVLAKDSAFYSTMATAIGALMGAQVVKSVGTAAVDGEGLKKGVQNLVSTAKPGDAP